MVKIRKEEVFKYHSEGKPGKISIVPSKKTETQRDLSLAYTPGVAEVSLAVYENPENAYLYTAKANLVAVVSDGSAVLGLGDIGPLAAKPVMEGKAVLFKKLADIDAIDIEVDAEDPDEFVKVVKAISPTFGGINLEDIKAPKCFIVEEKLIELLDIPVFHDDQHGTAIIVLAGLINALYLQNKDISDVKIVILGAGAAGIAIAKLLVKYGAKKENIRLLDSKGVIYRGRVEGMNPYKEEFAVETKERTLQDALKGADVFIGVSGPNLVSGEDLKLMADKPIIFALANPIPEVPYEVAISVRPDAIIATGRSDYPNQLNNVLGFPYIFRGALDVKAFKITDNMKIAAALALANLAKEEIPQSVLRAYGLRSLGFGRDYIIPKPLDPRLIYRISPEVARAAIKDGVARVKDFDIYAYTEKLRAHSEKAISTVRAIIGRGSNVYIPKIVFPEGENETILRVANILSDEGVAKPVLIGSLENIKSLMSDLKLDFDAEIIDPSESEKLDYYAQLLWRLRWKKGLGYEDAKEKVKNPGYLGTLMLYDGYVDAMLYGVVHNYNEAIRPVLEIIKTREGIRKVAGLYIALTEKGPLFMADTTVNPDPEAEDLVDIALMSAEVAKEFGYEPRIAFVSFSNFGTSSHHSVLRMRKALEILNSRYPDLLVDGEMHVDVALSEDLLKRFYPFSKLAQRGKAANILIFPGLNSSNTAYKILSAVAGVKLIGPILMGLKKPAHIIQKGDDEERILALAYYAINQVLSKLRG
ncbi:MAG: NADP-dependent malic enzyme [candidate division WOR-3 bacterium]